MSDLGRCDLCGRDEAYHRHLYESTRSMDLQIAQEHLEMGIARDEYEIVQAQKRIEASRRDLKRVKLLTESRRARALHELANIARHRDALCRCTPGVSVLTSRLLFGPQTCAIACKPDRAPSFTQPITIDTHNGPDIEYFDALPLPPGAPDGAAVEYRMAPVGPTIEAPASRMVGENEP